MRRNAEAFLWDIRESASRIREFVGDLDFAGFSRSALVQAAVERQFEIIGEALNQLSRTAPEIVRHHRLPQYSDSWLCRARSQHRLERRE
jgi:uncharacterized protein with HEPN domain